MNYSALVKKLNSIANKTEDLTERELGILQKFYKGNIYYLSNRQAKKLALILRDML